MYGKGDYGQMTGSEQELTANNAVCCKDQRWQPFEVVHGNNNIVGN